MSRYYERNDSGYTRGGLDVVTGINLFFKGILIFPILVLATFVGLTMVKFVLFHGLPGMNQPTEEQRQRIIDRDAQATAPAVPSLPAKPLEELRGYTIHTLPRDSDVEVIPYTVNTQGYGSQTPPSADEEWNTQIEEDPFN
jgi:hypothetical protein